jgi:membrane-bound lytic murein transglycosylase A
MTDGAPPLFTGYYEPELDGSPERSARFGHAIYRMPPGLCATARHGTAAPRSRRGGCSNGLEIAWLSDAVEAFLLQVQGSGRIRMTDGRTIRVGYAGRNGHAYRSVGAELVRRALIAADRISAEAIRDWVRANPDEGARLLRHNPPSSSSARSRCPPTSGRLARWAGR